MLGIIYEESIYTFIAFTLVMGGAAAFQTGRAVAQTWQSIWQLIPYMLLLTISVRFLYYAILGQTLLSAQFFAVDFVVLLIAGVIGWRLKRASQMTSQYRWLYAPAGPFNWRQK